MYIYELPPDINSELCRLLDINDFWKELAGDQMQYSPCDIIEIEQKARRSTISPTHQLFIRWGQLNHRVEELFVLLYYMKYVPAVQCLSPLMDDDKNRLLHHLYKNGNVRNIPRADSSNSSNTLPVRFIKQNNSSSKQNGRANDLADEIIRHMGSTAMIDYKELEKATDNWSKVNLLGQGGFGEVFKGEWLHSLVAVKRLRVDKCRTKELIQELSLNEYRHDNIVPLYGYSLRDPEACLIYQLMKGGSLQQRLRRNAHHPPLSWPQRYRIAHGVARGLQYLHNLRGTPLIHGDIKPANILLDQHLMPKIGDFGLARKGPAHVKTGDRTHVMVSRILGTVPYLPVEYVRSKELTTEVDVFSYGVVLLEMATALASHDKQRVATQEKSAAPMLYAHVALLARKLLDFATLEDPALRGTAESNPHLCWQFIETGLLCTRNRQTDRPTMLAVYERLHVMGLCGQKFKK